jgi:transcriptional regulator with XRE-family HTH domain
VKRARIYSPYAEAAARLLGAEVRGARLERRWSAQELADRAGITRATLAKVERGDSSVGLGAAFEAAALVGVPLFRDDPAQLSAEVARREDRLALLPQRVRPRRQPVRDDF